MQTGLVLVFGRIVSLPKERLEIFLHYFFSLKNYKNTTTDKYATVGILFLIKVVLVSPEPSLAGFSR